MNMFSYMADLYYVRLTHFHDPHPEVTKIGVSCDIGNRFAAEEVDVEILDRIVFHDRRIALLVEKRLHIYLQDFRYPRRRLLRGGGNSELYAGDVLAGLGLRYALLSMEIDQPWAQILDRLVSKDAA